RAGGEYCGDMRREPVVCLVPIAGKRARAVQLRAGQQVADASAERGAARAEHDDCGSFGQRAHPRPSRREISVIAKYGTSAASISRNGATRWFGNVARST